MIQLTDITKSYPTRTGRKTVLTGINYAFRNGCNTGLIGPNGVGKSTLMRLLSGAELPDSGVIKRESSVSWPLGFRGGLHGSLTGRENISFVARIYGRDYLEMLDFVQDFAEIGGNINEEVRTYSSGMRARVAFGLSMAVTFDFYLIDEVIAVGDISFKRKCKFVLAQRMAVSTVIMVSHSPTILKDFCDIGCVVENGQLIHFDKIGDALKYHHDAMR